mmetsp:Transcript_16656/g.20037  ORF Transcript_16656/g.20037 Transcript_16656/m.20037 type:complete len:257 (-) Transcript_16656:343-1113(-)|eukprot:CAMPEP_0197845326 /NCGR_PEP_ID=MMETSP1438-20131217/2272_1 /TAXON_ID=1461541 /ORGANISM="Pterosperma sp., Strain CCMP1384" /LENGTH=256 /DNA_ID=CAMNT_0043456577 /DNA_START=309 /DNA_END=1079 /DNA_ORIENTATION=+
MADVSSEDSDEIFTFKASRNLNAFGDSEDSDDEDDDDDVQEVEQLARGSTKESVGKDKQQAATKSPANPSPAKPSRRVDLDLPSPQPKRARRAASPPHPVDNRLSDVIRRNKELLTQLQAQQDEVEILEEDDQDVDDVSIVATTAPPEVGEPIVVKMRTQDGWEQNFNITTITKMSELFEMFEATSKAKEMRESGAEPAPAPTAKRGRGRKSPPKKKSGNHDVAFKYLFDGDRLQETQTPKGLDMDDEDVIDIGYA